jgi:intracellular sulfur oxidation DsrE/DsrF family protein
MAVAGLGTGAVVPVAESRRPLAAPWDMSWVERLKPAAYRVVIDANAIADGLPLDHAVMFLDQFREVYATRDDDTRAVIVARQLGAPLAFGDALWARYKIGEATHVTDPSTHAPARRNLFWSADGARGGSSLAALGARGVITLVCNIAARSWAASLAQEAGLEVERVRTDVLNGLVPGAMLVPSGIFALIRAQNAGCALLRA